MTVPRRIAIGLDKGLDDGIADRLFAADGETAVTAVLAARREQVAAIDDRHIDAIVCLCAKPSKNFLEFVREATAKRPWLPIVIGCPADAGDAVRELVSAGAADVVAMVGDDEATGHQLAFVLEKVIAQRANSGREGADRGQVITILGPKGGTGKTLTTCNLAVALAQAGSRVAVVDLDLQFGDVGLALGLDPVNTIHDLVATGGTLDGEKLNSYLTVHKSGVRTLLAPIRPDQAEAVTVDFVRAVIAELRLAHDMVIVDTPPGFTPAVIAAIDASTSLCVVSTLDSLSLKNTRVALDTLELMDWPDHATRLVLNRADSDVGVKHRDVEALLGRRPDIMIPSSASITRAVNEAMPIVAAEPTSPAAAAFAVLADEYGPVPVVSEPDPSPRRRRSLAPGLRTIRKAVS